MNIFSLNSFKNSQSYTCNDFVFKSYGDDFSLFYFLVFGSTQGHWPYGIFNY